MSLHGIFQLCALCLSFEKSVLDPVLWGRGVYSPGVPHYPQLWSDVIFWVHLTLYSLELQTKEALAQSVLNLTDRNIFSLSGVSLNI